MNRSGISKRHRKLLSDPGNSRNLCTLVSLVTRGRCIRSIHRRTESTWEGNDTSPKEIILVVESNVESNGPARGSICLGSILHSPPPNSSSGSPKSSIRIFTSSHLASEYWNLGRRKL